MFSSATSLLLLGLASLVHAHAGHHHVHRRQEADSGLQTLFDGNARFVSKIQSANPTLLADLTANGQEPPFMFIGCSDSRVSEGTIFDAEPGTLFTERNIANQFSQNDANAHTIMSYAVAELGVKHVIVMGHYGCGGVAAAIATPPEGIVDAANGAIQNWIAPIRAIFETSTRPEIVALRESIAGVAVVEEPEPEDPGFRALVEENVKASVKSIASSSVIKNHFAALAEGTAERKRAEGGPLENVFIHGFVYDIANGQIQNLGISVGPPGVEIPEIPFAAVGAAVEAASTEAAAEATATESAAASEATATESAAVEATATESAASEATSTESAATEAAASEAVKPLENSESGSSGEAVTLKCKEQCKSKRRLQKRLSGDY